MKRWPRLIFMDLGIESNKVFGPASRDVVEASDSMRLDPIGLMLPSILQCVKTQGPTTQLSLL
jgi:hypothetical protein